ncbi:MAG: RNA-binding protein [Filimonas sp.]|nr:RNA-binding protein [Filimonas sp.]
MKMTVSGLPANFDKFDLQRLFNPFGWVKYARIYLNPITGLSARKGLVEIEDEQQARKAMEALQGKVLDKNPLNIKEVKDKNPR